MTVACPACGTENPDGFRLCGMCGSPLAAPAAERRKLATILFCDVIGSTAMGEAADPELVRGRVSGYFQQARACIERHGGTVEKFAGDAVMAAFGVPESHEDDALRACRAALEIQERSPLPCRIGIASGEVVAGEGAETFVTGDAVNTAARLEQAADPGEVVIAEQTYLLCRAGVEAEPLPSVDAKGKAEPVTAFRLLAATTAARRLDEGPLVGRESELAELVDAFAQVTRGRRCRLVTLVGEPGVGKSRLVSELEDRVDARVLTGRCLSYGEGITFWPLAEIVREAAGMRDEDSLEQARAKLAALVEPEIARPVAALVGLGGTVAAEEVAWAVRRFVSALAAERPLLLVVEDVHWAEATLLDLLVELERLDEPVLILATARPELVEERPDWSGVVRLDPLSGEATVALLTRLLRREPDEELVARAGGNPLFVHELAALLRDGGEPAEIPASLSALLGARLDRLAAPERETVERASIEGEVFHRGAVASLLEIDVRQTAERLSALVERKLAFPVEARFLDESAYGFRHVLVRDAAYAGLVKRLRAELHERFADWLEEKAGDRLGEVEEIVGYHLEQAVHYGRELGLATEALAERAAERLYAAGSRLGRADVPGALNLVRRAVSLTSQGNPARAERLLYLGTILFAAGEMNELGAVFAEAERAAIVAGDERTATCVRLDMYNPNVELDERRRAAEAAIPAFEAAADEGGLARAWAAIADYHWHRDQLGPSHEAFERALVYARRSGTDPELADDALARLTAGFRFGPYPVAQAIARMERELEDHAMSPHARTVWPAKLAVLEARRGNLARARSLCASARDLAGEFGDILAAYWVCDATIEVELLAGDAARAEQLARENLARTERLGWDKWERVKLAEVLLEQDRLAEAEEALAAADAGAEGIDRIRLDRVTARVLARRGQYDAAERRATTAVELVEKTDAMPDQAQTYRALAEVLDRAGKPDEARQALERALELEEARGATLLAERTRALLTEAGAG